MPTDVHVEKQADGAVTVWMSENEPLDRMKGMVGIHLAPGEARFDTRMKVYNRTASRHSFLWWENAAVPVNPQYRLVFPPDVGYVQFHYRKNVTTYPVASGVYNGIRMGEGTDISWHKNTRQPTSYFCAETGYSFFGGYDEGKRCGVIHVADRTVSVGKKMFTWAYNQLSASWEKALTDTDGPYAELMASSYSLNQPDFTWLMPYEGKEFSQMWYPIGDIGAPVCACEEAAISYEEGELRLQATVPLKGATLEVDGQRVILDASPLDIFRMPLEQPPREITLYASSGKRLARYEKPAEHAAPELPATIPDNPTLDQLKTAQELYLMGVHAEQYRDPATRPDAYWREALRRDPEYAPALTAMAAYELNHFRYESALEYASRAWKKVTFRNYHPESGELQYTMGRILEALGREDEALEWYMQSAWQQDSRGRALTRAAMIEGRRYDLSAMGKLAEKALQEHSRNETASLLLALSRKEDPEGMRSALRRILDTDPLNNTCRYLMTGPVPSFYEILGSDPCQTALDITEELEACGEKQLAADLLSHLPAPCAQTEYVRWALSGDGQALHRAKSLGTGIAYPSRQIEYRALRAAVQEAPEDDTAMNLLGCLLYHNGNHREAGELWRKAAELNPKAYMPRRNLAVAYYSHLNRREESLALLDQAIKLHPGDDQLIWEKAYALFHTGQTPKTIAEFLRQKDHPREDIAIELSRALNLAGEYEEALKTLLSRKFTPCEGGEHAVAEQYMFAHHALGRRALAAGKPEEALAHFRAAQALPDSLGAGLWNDVLLVPHRYYEALTLIRMGEGQEAEKLLNWILMLKQDYFSDMHLPELPCWQAMAEKLLGRSAPAMERIAAHLRAQAAAEAAIDPGYRKTTPFFISYMEDAPAQRRGIIAWQKAMAYTAAGDPDRASGYAAESLRLDPTNLYATLMIFHEIER